MSKVVGIERNVSFKYDGKDYSGIRLFCTEESSKENLEGITTSADFVGDHKSCYEVASKLKIGDEIKIYRNSYKKIDEILLL